MAEYTIPSNECEIFGAGYFKGDAIVQIEGAENGLAGYNLAGWSAEVEDRPVPGGPLVRGPHVYAYGLAGVVDCRGGTSAINAEAEKHGALFRVRPGDVLVIAGIRVRVSLCWRRYPELTVL